MLTAVALIAIAAILGADQASLVSADPSTLVNAVAIAETGSAPLRSGLPGIDETLVYLKQSFLNEANAHPNLYDPQDVDAFMSTDSYLSHIKFFNQRSGDWLRAYGLAVNTLRWRKAMGLNSLDASKFPCDLFKLGLIFEYGQTHQHQDLATGQIEAGSPVIWIRLGALGKVVKHLERFTPKRLISFVHSTARTASKKARHFVNQATLRLPPHKARSAPLIRDLSMKENPTIEHVLRAIAWYLNNWMLTHPADARATLVLDFEGTDFAFSSWSMGQFFVKLDDNFPDLFDQILGYRYKPKLWSLHSPISMFNRIFKSRISSSPETDAKIKFIRNEPEISTFMPRVDVNGYSMLPEHVSGECIAPNIQAPAGCGADTNALAGSGLFNPLLWEAVHNEFYQMCRPKARQH